MIEKKYLEDLNKISLFSHLSQDNLERLLNSFNSKIITLDKNEILFNEGEVYHNMCILLDGEVILSNTDEYGNRNIRTKFLPRYFLSLVAKLALLQQQQIRDRPSY